MSNRYAEVVILAEDERSANLLRRYVMRALDIGNRRIRQESAPSARGDAKRWILDRYPIEVAELRRKHRKTALVVHIDADVETVLNRSRALAGALSASGRDARRNDERISHAIPRRHTETWLCILIEIAVDEDQDCKRQHLPPEPDRTVRPAAEAFYKLTRQNAPPPALPSLVTAVSELRRLE